MNNVLIIQHIWTRWSKRSRGNQSAIARLRPQDAYPLPGRLPDARAICHEIRCLEQDNFSLLERLAAIDGPASRQSFTGFRRLTWHIGKDALQFRFRSASGGRRNVSNRRPEFVNFVVRPDQPVRLDWNARLPMSLTGSNRSSIYEQHTFRIYHGSCNPVPDFEFLIPVKSIDLTRHIY